MRKPSNTGWVSAVQRLFLAAVFVVPVVPCVVSADFVFPYMSAKGHLFRMAVDVAVACWAILALSRDSCRIRFSPILWSTVAFVAVLGLSGWLGACPARSLLGNLERMEGWLTHLHLLGLLVVLPAAVATERLWGRFFAVSVSAGLVVTAVALGQLAGMVPMDSVHGRPGGTLGNPSFLAAYLSAHIWLVIFLLMRGSVSNRIRVFGGLVVALQGAVLLGTATRSAVLGVTAGALVAAALLMISKLNKKQSFIVVASAVGLLLAAGGAAFFFAEADYQTGSALENRVSDSPSDLTGHGRLLAWRAALEGAGERPWLGWGQENFSVVYARYYDPRLYTHDPFFDRVHNVFLQWLVAGGVPGLVVFLSVIGSFVGVVWRGSTFTAVERSLLTGLVVGWGVHSALLFDTLTTLIFAVVILAYVHWRWVADRPPGRSLSPGVRKAVCSALLLLAALAAGVTLRTMTAEQALVAAVRPDARGLLGNLESFRRALRHTTPATPKVRERLLTTAVDIGRSGKQNPEVMGQLTTLGVREMEQQIRAWPLDVRSQVALASFLWRFGALQEAEKILEHAHGLAPRMQHILFELGAVQLSLKKNDTALQTLRTAYELAPEWTLARDRYAATAVAVGRRDIAESLLMPAEGTIAIGDEWMINALRKTKDLPNLVVALKKRIRAVRRNGGDTSGLEEQLQEARRAQRRGESARE